MPLDPALRRIGAKTRPYTGEQIAAARSTLAGKGYDANTIRCAEGLNTPLWQGAIPEPHAQAIPSREPAQW